MHSRTKNITNVKFMTKERKNQVKLRIKRLPLTSLILIDFLNFL